MNPNEVVKLYISFTEYIKERNYPESYDTESEFTALLKMCKLLNVDTTAKSYKEVKEELLICIANLNSFVAHYE